MAHQQTKTVRLERLPHRDAQERLRQAYLCLIEKGRPVLQSNGEKEKAKEIQEVKS